MRGLGTSFLVRRARSTWLLLACVAVTVLAATVLAAALWTFEAESIPQGTRVILAASHDRTLAITSPPAQAIAGGPGTIRAALIAGGRQIVQVAVPGPVAGGSRPHRGLAGRRRRPGDRTRPLTARS